MKVITKPLFKRLAIGLGLLIVLALVVNGFFAWRAQQRFDSIIAKIKAAGEPASLADLAPQHIPAEKNAAAILHEATPQLEAFVADESAFGKTPMADELYERQNKGLAPNAEQLAAIRKIVDAHSQIVSGLQKASDCTEYASLSDFSMPAGQYIADGLERISQFRALANFVEWKTEVLAADGKSDDAVRLGVQFLRVARLYDHEPCLVNYLVSIAGREIAINSINSVVREDQIAANVRAELEAELAQQDNDKPFRHALLTNRALSISMIQELTGRWPRFLSWPALNKWLNELAIDNQAYDVAKLPFEQLLEQWGLVGKTPKEMVASFRKSGGSLGGAIMTSAYAEATRLVQTRCLRVLNALGEYRQRTDKEAENIEQLSLPSEAMIDPWSGKPLLLKKTDQGWIVYSVGQNGVDDGGDFKELRDVGFGPPGYPHE